MQLIGMVKVLEIGGSNYKTFYLRIPASLREKLAVNGEDLFFCYFNEASKAITYVPKAKGKEV